MQRAKCLTASTYKKPQFVTVNGAWRSLTFARLEDFCEVRASIVWFGKGSLEISSRSVDFPTDSYCCEQKEGHQPRA